MRAPLLPVALLAAALSQSAIAQTLELLLPAGGSRGQQVDVVCYGRDLKDTKSVVWLHPDETNDAIEVLQIEPAKDRVKLHLQVHDDCPFGAHLFALHTARGLTRPKAFHVSPLPSIPERRDHATRADAQRIALNLTVDGRLLAEDLDWYAFETDQGQVVRAEVQAVRLGLSDIDVQMEAFGPDGQLIARWDDSPLGKADPLACFVATQTGTHWLCLRDVAYRGSSAFAYRLHVGTFPRPLGVLPCGGKPGETLTVQLLGDGEPGEAVLTLPKEDGLHNVFVSKHGKSCPTPIAVVVDNRANFVEGNLPSEPPSAPCAYHGVIAAAHEEDSFAFVATKGERLSIQVRARNLNSPLDPILTIRDATGKELSSIDDGVGLDARATFTAPATGNFTVCVRDHLGHGSNAHFYRIEIGLTPGDAATLEAVPGRRSEDLGVAIPRGRRNATLVRTNGIDTSMIPTVSFVDLPPGVQARPFEVNATQFAPLVLTASADAPIQAGLATPTLHYQGEAVAPGIRHRHIFPALRVRNNEVYASELARTLPVVVTEAVPFDVAVAEPRVPIVQSGSLSLAITVARDDKFSGTVTVRALALPAGVSGSTLTLTGTKTTGDLILNANSQASIGIWPVVLIASATIDGVACTISTDVITLAIEQPWLTAKLPKTRIEQGQVGTFAIELEPKRSFTGEVTAVLGRIPKGVTYEVPKIEGTATTLTVPIQAATDAPTGRHRSIYIQLMIDTGEGVVTHTIGSGEIRVDAPLPATTPAPANPSAATPPPSGSKTDGAKP